MNLSDTLASHKSASALDLFRPHAAIDRVLDQPGWMLAVRARLQAGKRSEQTEIWFTHALRPHGWIPCGRSLAS
jgi:hypothetical protein